MTDAELAAELAAKAGEILLKVRESGMFEGKALGDAGDRIACVFILDALKAQRPDDGILCEDTTDTAERLGHKRVWIIDPLDGTREYAEGRDDWAVHVALSIGGEPLVGAVALPAEGLVLRSDRPEQFRADEGQRVRMLVSRTRPPAETARVAEALGAELMPMGSAGAKAAAVVLGRGDIYLHAGGQYQWDNCAPAAVALAAGLSATRLNGDPLRYNGEDPSMPDLLICRPELLQAIQAALA